MRRRQCPFEKHPFCTDECSYQEQDGCSLKNIAENAEFCGECPYMLDEDIDGNGFCNLYKVLVNCEYDCEDIQKLVKKGNK